MKAKLLTIVCAGAIGFSSVTPALATDQADPVNVVADIVVVRPVCLASTVVCSAFFVVSLPFAAISKSIKPTAKTLLVKPAQATFTRPVGDMDALRN